MTRDTQPAPPPPTHGSPVKMFRYREDGPVNIFGGAAARDDVRVDENGFYQPRPLPLGVF